MNNHLDVRDKGSTNACKEVWAHGYSVVTRSYCYSFDQEGKRPSGTASRSCGLCTFSWWFLQLGDDTDAVTCTLCLQRGLFVNSFLYGCAEGAVFSHFENRSAKNHDNVRSSPPLVPLVKLSLFREW
jgi:hypothetical protein